MHSAALYHYYWRWRTQKRSIEHTELTFNEALAFRWPSDQLGPPVIRLYSLLKLPKHLEIFRSHEIKILINEIQRVL